MRTLQVSEKSLYSMRSLILSPCRDLRMDVIHHSTCKAVLNLLERFLSLERMYYSELQYSSSEWTLEAAIVLAVFIALIMTVTTVHNDLVLSTDVG